MMRRYFLLDLTLDIKHAKFYGVEPTYTANILNSSGAVPGKAGKAAALPRFCKIESGGGGGSGGVPPYWWSYLARVRAPRRRRR